MTFRKQWPQKRTEYPTSNRAKSQKQYFAAKRQHMPARVTSGCAPTRARRRVRTRTARYAPTTARSRAPRGPRPSDPRGPAPAGRCPPCLAPLLPAPAERRDPPGPCQAAGGRPPTRAVRHHQYHPDTPLNAADPGRGRAAEKPGKPRPRQSCARRVVECRARRGRGRASRQTSRHARNARRVDRSPAHAC